MAIDLGAMTLDCSGDYSVAAALLTSNEIRLTSGPLRRARLQRSNVSRDWLSDMRLLYDLILAGARRSKTEVISKFACPEDKRGQRREQSNAAQNDREPEKRLSRRASGQNERNG